ncbi:MAG: two-component system response regulator [Candidatus Muproteobacteria bacterium RBG_16_65_34]|uniref:Two-component system response regulator n=1 Tax=Candidatus Muproteobacteria bacterium RBG_16_65_34 TaxID=1817760 RepID=A0A1F6TS65_9PROT|nr:MAG: two-component system response regulator [Candidatus Muproteobacteria bacterium RBG_16_65_34]
MAVRTVLVVDDSATDLKNLEQIVSGGGYSVITATSGKEAVSKAKSEHPDAVLLDVIMNDMNGFQACRTITSDPDTQDIPVVLVSSKGEKTDKLWGAENGAKGYITKPFTAQQVLDQLRAL